MCILLIHYILNLSRLFRKLRKVSFQYAYSLCGFLSRIFISLHNFAAPSCHPQDLQHQSKALFMTKMPSSLQVHSFPLLYCRVHGMCSSHPIYSIQTYFIEARQMVITPNAKLDRGDGTSQQQRLHQEYNITFTSFTQRLKSVS